MKSETTPQKGLICDGSVFAAPLFDEVQCPSQPRMQQEARTPRVLYHPCLVQRGEKKNHECHPAGAAKQVIVSWDFVYYIYPIPFEDLKP